MKNTRFSVICFVVLALLGSAQAMAGAKVYAVHGIPDTPVDVYVNGSLGLSNFQYKGVAGPIELAAGNYTVDIFLAGSDPGSGAPVLTLLTGLTDGQAVSLVAHLTADGALALTPFSIDLSRPAFGSARLGVRHTALAPAVDAIARAGFPKAHATIGASNLGGASVEVPSAFYRVALALPGTSAPLFGPLTLGLDPGKIYYVYAVGVFGQPSFDLILQKLTQSGAQQ